eukprot:1150314-Pelagomonas_calceolata.AAC.3
MAVDATQKLLKAHLQPTYTISHMLHVLCFLAAYANAQEVHVLCRKPLAWHSEPQSWQVAPAELQGP